MEAVVLAAGEGKRMHPFTLTRPKPLIPIAGIPLLKRLLSTLREGGVRSVVLVVKHLSDQIEEFFGDGSPLGMEIRYAHQRSAEGTAQAIGAAEEYLSGDTFLVVAGDLLITPRALDRIFESCSEYDTVIAVTPVDDPERYGIVETRR